MKKLFYSIIFISACINLSAKKVKFAVDMTSYTISPNGIHMISDFQVLTGYGAMDWDPSTMPLTQEGSSSVYSIIVDLPAFQKYEFKFVNGIQGYEAEYVPEQARVGYGFNDNRWMYIDSLTNDTSFMGAIQFSNNSPVGKTLIRYKVDMTGAGTVSADGVHVGTNYETVPFDASKIRLYSFGSNVYEIINYVNANTYNYIFYNGNIAGGIETVPATCAASGKRSIVLQSDSILAQVCFSSCQACTTSGLKENTGSNELLSVYPNPSKETITITSLSANLKMILIFDNTGQLVMSSGYSSSINIGSLKAGIYFLKVNTANGSVMDKKIIVE